MNFIPMQILEYRFNDEGITQKIIIVFQHYKGNEQFNVRVVLDQEYVSSVNNSLVLDRMNKDQIEAQARRKMRDWIMTTRPEKPVEEPVE